MSAIVKKALEQTIKGIDLGEDIAITKKRMENTLDFINYYLKGYNDAVGNNNTMGDASDGSTSTVGGE